MISLARPLARFALLLVVLSAGAARAAAPAEPLVMLPPIGDTPEASDLGYLMHERAEKLLVEQGGPAVTSLRLVLTAAELLRAAPASWFGGAVPEQLGRLLGASRVVAGRLRDAPGGGYLLELQVVDHGKAGAIATTTLPASLAAAVRAGGRALAKHALPSLADKDEPAPSVPDRAVTDWAACTASALRQPLLLQSPALVRISELDRASADCRDALKLAPKLVEARATLGLVLALLDRAKEAVEVLAPLPTKPYDPSLWLAHYWLATRYRSAEAGLAVLRETVRRFPTSLLARVMLAEHLYVIREYAAAMPAWNDVLALAPNSPLTRSRVSAVLARLGKHDEAIALAKEMVSVVPGDPSAVLVLASRYIDAGRHRDAITALEPLAVHGAPPQVFERLGWAYLRTAQLDKAESAFERAREASALSTGEWRVRARALAGLVRVAAARRDDEATERLLRQAQQEDFEPFLRGLHDATISNAFDGLAAGRDPTTGGRRPPRAGAPAYSRPSEATPFLLDPTGEVDPHRREPATPPTFIDVLRF